MKEFTDYLQSKNLANATQSIYLRYVNGFLDWHKKELTNCTKKDILNYLAHLKNKKQHENITRRNTLLAINHYFTFLLKTEAVTKNPTTFLKIRGANKKKLYNIFTHEELTQLADDYNHNFVRNYNTTHFSTFLLRFMVQQNRISDTYRGVQTSCTLHIFLSEFLRSLDTEILWLLFPEVLVCRSLCM